MIDFLSAPRNVFRGALLANRREDFGQFLHSPYSIFCGNLL